MQLFINSGTFESLDAITTWANNEIFRADVIRVNHVELIRIFDHETVHYRMQLLLEVTEKRIKEHMLKMYHEE